MYAEQVSALPHVGASSTAGDWYISARPPARREQVIVDDCIPSATTISIFCTAGSGGVMID